jgi:hypothetical protein
MAALAVWVGCKHFHSKRRPAHPSSCFCPCPKCFSSNSRPLFHLPSKLSLPYDTPAGWFLSIDFCIKNHPGTTNAIFKPFGALSWIATVNLESRLSSASKNKSRSLRSSGLGVLNVRVEPCAVCSWICDAFVGPLLLLHRELE